MKRFFIFCTALFAVLCANSQVVLISESVDNVIQPTLPMDWTSTLVNDIGFRSDSSNFSTGYTGATGLKNIAIKNSDGTGTYSLYSPTIDASDYEALTISWATRVSTNFLASGSTVPILEASGDGGLSWLPVSFVENDANSVWAIVNAGTPISLPAELNHSATVQLRWTVNIVTNSNGTYRMDDFAFSGIYNPLVPVTFSVNTIEELNVTSVGVNYSVNGVDFTAPMGLLTASTYATQVWVSQNSILNYRFSINTFSETVPAECGVLFNGTEMRTVNIGQSPAVLPTVCFGQCSDCVVVQVTYSVNMSQQSISPNGVSLIYLVNGVSVVNTMTLIGGGVYQTSVTHPVGAIVNYKFVNGGATGLQETVPSDCAFQVEGIGFRTITIGNSDIILDPICFEECSNCVIVSPNPVELTFQVNMNQQSVSGSGVYLAGSFNNWNPLANPMTNNGSGIYSAVVQVLEGDVVQYVFVNGNQIAAMENVASSCSVDGPNGMMVRNTFAGSTNETVPVVCFNECADCVEQPQTVQITFQVDMSTQIISANGVHVMGNFNNWNASETTLLNAGSGIYLGTIDWPMDSLLRYRFVNGDAWTEAETVPNPCGLVAASGGNDRYFLSTSANTDLDAVCFGACTNCALQVEETSTLESVSLYPNPTSNNFRVQTNQLIQAINVLNAAGQKVFAVSNLNVGSYDILTSDWKQGVYFVQLISNDFNSTLRLTVVH